MRKARNCTGISGCTMICILFCIVTRSPTTAFSSSRASTGSLVHDTAPLVEFTTPEMYVFIEDTDAYGVMYNSNYLRAYDRALHMISISNRKNSLLLLNPEDTKNASVLDHEGWSLIEVNDQKFKSSPPLGGAFVVNGKLLKKSDNNRSEVWELTLMEPPTSGQVSPNESSSHVVYNTATVTIASPNLSTRCIPKPDPFVSDPSCQMKEHSFMLYRDEFDLHLPSHPSLRNVMNLFERSRSNFLGGPDLLRKMQEEDDLLWVVISSDKCSLVNLGHDESDIEAGIPRIESKPGQTVIVKTSFVPKRRGMIIECKQTLLLPPSENEPGTTGRRRLAQGILSLMAINGKTRRPTSKLPGWVRDIIEGSSEKSTIQ